MTEEIIWLEEEIKICEEGRLRAINNAEADINERDYYSRRKEFFNKILALINKD
jgi:hypothetical protein